MDLLSSFTAPSPGDVDRRRAPLAEPTGTAARPLVLVVEDNPAMRATLRRHLGFHGFEVIEAGTGRSARRLMQEHHAGIAVVDLGLPDCDGLSLVRAMRDELGPWVRITVLTGDTSMDSRIRAFDSGADDVVAKPAHLPEFVRRLLAAYRLQTAQALLHAHRHRAERLRLFTEEAIALLAHDLNNGFAAALANLDLLTFAGQPPDDREGALEATRVALERMAMLVSNFVDVSRFEDERMTLRCQRIELPTFLNEVAGIHRNLLESCNGKMEIVCPPGLEVHADASLLERTLHNLIGNASRYVDHQGTVWVCAAPTPEGVTFSVENSGPPVPPELRPVLFDKYSRDETYARSRGMGLYFCRLAVEAHGGAIDYAYEDGRSRFFFTLTRRVP